MVSPAKPSSDSRDDYEEDEDGLSEESSDEEQEDTVDYCKGWCKKMGRLLFEVP